VIFGTTLKSSNSNAQIRLNSAVTPVCMVEIVTASTDSNDFLPNTNAPDSAIAVISAHKSPLFNVKASPLQQQLQLTVMANT